MIKVTINSEEYEVPEGITVIQACELAGIEIPRFCYHERLAIAGNCRMCLVEVEGGPPKPVASCAMPVVDGIKIKTNTPTVKKAREGVMEFLLINHPLDCPICDQGGECDLQDQAMSYGRALSRFNEKKRSVKAKNFGPLIKTEMTRCIHCTRCVRFLSDIAGSHELGVINRGENAEITTLLGDKIKSELSGNIIDLCPVGALTSLPYAFKARPWELSSFESIDVLDAVGSAIRIDVKGNEVMRILPRLNEDINEEWISDKTRFSYDGLKFNRIDRPYIKKNNRLMESSWEEALSVVKNKISSSTGDKIGAISGNLADCESILLLKELLLKLDSCNFECRADGAKLNPKNRADYVFNTTIPGIEKSDLCLLVGTNPRYEAPMINTRLRKNYLGENFNIGYIGNESNFTYPVENLGEDVTLLIDILNKKNDFCKKLEKSKFPMIILGQNAICGENGYQILNLCKAISEKFGLVREDWNGFNVLHDAASRVGALDLGFANDNFNKNLDVLILLGVDEYDFSQIDADFIVYQGHHGDEGAKIADVILPGAAYTEKTATYVNTEGRAQRAFKATFPPGEAKEDWEIINNLSLKLGIDLGVKNPSDVQNKLSEMGPQFSEIDTVVVNRWEKPEPVNKENLNSKLVLKKVDFYKTNCISRSSNIMSKCSEDFGNA